MNQKNENLELLRIVSCVMVVVIHVSNYFCRAYGEIPVSEYVFALVLNTASRVSVPCFFMISGALLLGRKESMEKCLRRTGRFAITLAVWTCIYYLFNTYYTKQECDLSLLLQRPAEAHLWYLYVMIPIYIMLPFLQSMCQGMDEKLEHALAALGGIWVLVLHIFSYANLSWYYDLPVLGDRSYIYYFFMGYYLNKHRAKYIKKTEMAIVLFCVCVLGNVLLTSLGSTFIGDHYERTLEYGNPLIMLSSFLFFVVVIQYKNGELEWGEKAKWWIRQCAGCSFGIYLIHILFLDIYKMNVEAKEYSSFAAIPLLTVVILVLSFLVIYWLKKISYMQKLL